MVEGDRWLFHFIDDCTDKCHDVSLVGVPHTFQGRYAGRPSGVFHCRISVSVGPWAWKMPLMSSRGMPASSSSSSGRAHHRSPCGLGVVLRYRMYRWFPSIPIRSQAQDKGLIAVASGTVHLAYGRAPILHGVDFDDVTIFQLLLPGLTVTRSNGCWSAARDVA